MTHIHIYCIIHCFVYVNKQIQYSNKNRTTIHLSINFAIAFPYMYVPILYIQYIFGIVFSITINSVELNLEMMGPQMPLSLHESEEKFEINSIYY